MLDVDDIIKTMDINLGTTVGVAIAVMLIVSFAKKMFPICSGKESLLALVLSMLLCLSLKFSGEAFIDKGWITLTIEAIVASIGAMVGHDKINETISPLNKGKQVL